MREWRGGEGYGRKRIYKEKQLEPVVGWGWGRLMQGDAMTTTVFECSDRRHSNGIFPLGNKLKFLRRSNRRQVLRWGDDRSEQREID